MIRVISRDCRVGWGVRRRGITSRMGPGYNIEYDLAIAPMVMHYNTCNILDDSVIAWLWLCVWLCI